MSGQFSRYVKETCADWWVRQVWHSRLNDKVKTSFDSNKSSTLTSLSVSETWKFFRLRTHVKKCKTRFQRISFLMAKQIYDKVFLLTYCTLMWVNINTNLEKFVLQNKSRNILNARKHVARVINRASWSINILRFLNASKRGEQKYFWLLLIKFTAFD